MCRARGYQLTTPQKKVLRWVWKVSTPSMRHTAEYVASQNSRVESKIWRDQDQYMSRASAATIVRKVSYLVNGDRRVADAVSHLLLGHRNARRPERGREKRRVERISAFLQGDDSVESLVMDIRTMQTHPTKFNRWFRIANRMIKETATACHERRHTGSEYMTTFTGVSLYFSCIYFLPDPELTPVKPSLSGPGL